MNVLANRSNSMIPRIVLAAVALAAAGGALPGAVRRAAALEIRKVNERLVPFKPGGEVKIGDKNGRLVVEAWPRNEVRIQITRVVRADDRARADELMKELTSDVEVRKNRIDIESRFPKRRESIGILDILGRKVASLQINYYIQVPKQTSLVLVTSNGEVRVLGTSGPIEATTTNGDIRVEGVKGSLVLVTTNGEVHLTDVSGEVEAHTTNGTVVAQIRNLPAQGRVELETTNGNVNAYFPADLKATLEASTTNGRVASAFPIVRQGLGTSKSIRGTIQGGGAKISLATTNGNVEVRKIGQGRP
jgi:hypothetical protein